MSAMSKNNVTEDDDDDQDYIPVGILQVSSLRQPSNLEINQTQTAPIEEGNVRVMPHSHKQLNHPPSVHQTALNLPQFEQLEVGEFEQGQSKQNNETFRFQAQSQTHQKPSQLQTLVKDDVFLKASREHEGKQDSSPRYKLLLQLMQQQQKAKAQNSNDQVNLNTLKLQAKIRASTLMQSNSSLETQKQLQRVPREDLNSNVPVESENQLLKILSLAQRDDPSMPGHVLPQSGQKHEHISIVDNIVNSNNEIPSPQGPIKQNISPVVDNSVMPKTALRLDISSSFHHIPKSTEYVPQQSPTSITHPNMNHQHPEITKRLNSPVSPGRQSTSPRQAISPRHAGSPRQVSSSPCQFISPKQPLSPRGTMTVIGSRKSQPSSPQSFHLPKVQTGFSWQPPSSSQVIPTKKLNTSSYAQDLLNPVSQFLDPLSSPTSLTQEASVENIHHHSSRFQPIPSSIHQRILSGGIVHHRAPLEVLPGPSLGEYALLSSLQSTLSHPKTLTSQSSSNSESLGDNGTTVTRGPICGLVLNNEVSHADTQRYSSIVSHSVEQSNALSHLDKIKDFDNSGQPVPTDENPILRGVAELKSTTNPKLTLGKTGEDGDSFIQKINCEISPNTHSQDPGSLSTMDKQGSSEKFGGFKEQNAETEREKADNKIKSENHKGEKHQKDNDAQGSDHNGKDLKSEGEDCELNEDVEPANVKKVDKKQNNSEDSKIALKSRNLSVSESSEKIEDSENISDRITSSKRLRKPKVPFEDSSLVSGKIKKTNEKRSDKASTGKSESKGEKQQKQKVLKVKGPTTLKQSVLTRSSLRRKACGKMNKIQMLKHSNGRNSLGRFIKRSLRGSDLMVKNSRLVLKKVDKTSKDEDRFQKVEITTQKEPEKSLRSGKEPKQEQKKGSEVTALQQKGKDVNKDQKKEPKRGNGNTQEHKKEINEKETKKDQKKIGESSREQSRGSNAIREQRRISDVSQKRGNGVRKQRRGSDVGKKTDREQKQVSNKESASSATESESNTRSSSRLSARQSTNPEDKNKYTSRSRSRNRESDSNSTSSEKAATSSSKNQETVKDANSTPNAKVATRGSKIQEPHKENNSTPSEKVATRGSRTRELSGESNSTPNEKVATRGTKTHELSRESNSTPIEKVATRGTKAQESSRESMSTPNEMIAIRGSRTQDTSEESNSTPSNKVATRGSKTQDVSARSDTTPNERVGTRGSRAEGQVFTSSEKTISRGMTTRNLDGTRIPGKRHIESMESHSVSTRKRTRSEEVSLSRDKDLPNSLDMRSTRSKSGVLPKNKQHIKDSDEDEDFTVDDEESGEDSSTSPTMTRSGRMSYPRRKMSMRLRGEARKKKYNADESASEESIQEDDDDDDDDDDDKSNSDSDEKIKIKKSNSFVGKKKERKYSDSDVKSKQDPSVLKQKSNVKDIDSQSPNSTVNITDQSKLMGFKLVPLTPEEMTGMRGSESMLPLNGFILPGTNCIFLPPHCTQHLKTEKMESSSSTTTSRSAYSVPQTCTRVLATPRPISSVTESSMKTSAFSSPSCKPSPSSYGSHHAVVRNYSGIVPSTPTPPPPASASLPSSLSSSTRTASSVTSSHPWNSPSLPTPPPSVSSSSSHSSSSWNPVANLPWMQEGTSSTWNNEAASTNEGWRNNAYMSRAPYGDNLALNSDVQSMHNSSHQPQRLHQDISSGGHEDLYNSDRISPPMEADSDQVPNDRILQGFFRDSSNLSPSNYNIALPGLGQQDISYLESKLQQEMDISILTGVPYEEEIPEPVTNVHHGNLVCSVNLDDADVGRLGNVSSGLQLPGSGLENINLPQSSVSSTQEQAGYLAMKEDGNTSLMEELRMEQRMEPNVPPTNMSQAVSSNVVAKPAEKTSLMNTRKHLYEVCSVDGKKLCKCLVCGNAYNLSSIYRHLKKHDNPNLAFPCSICGKKFAQKHHLTLHFKKVHNTASTVNTQGVVKKEEAERVVPKPNQGESLDSLSVEKSMAPPETESDTRVESKEGIESKEGKKKARKRSVERKIIKDGLVYEMMPESPHAINVECQRETKRQLERFRKMKAKKKFAAGKNVYGITMDLSLLDAETSDEEEDKEEKIEKDIRGNDNDSHEKQNLAGVHPLSDHVKFEQKQNLENEHKIMMMEIGGDSSSGVNSGLVSISSPSYITSTYSGGNINANTGATASAALSDNKRLDGTQGSNNKDLDSSKNIIEAVVEDQFGVAVHATGSQNAVKVEGQGDRGIVAGGGVSETGKETTENIKQKFPCTLCKSVLASKCSLFLHMKRHRSVKDKFCNYCGKGFITGQELRSHERTHTGERPFVCEICKYSFAHSGSYQTHKRGHLKRGETEPFPPDRCYKEDHAPLRKKKRSMSDASEKREGATGKKALSRSVPKDSSINVAQTDAKISGSETNLRRSLDSGLDSGFAPQNLEHFGSSPMRPPWSASSPGDASWETGRTSTEQNVRHVVTPESIVGPDHKGQPRSTTNFREQPATNPSFYSPTHYGTATDSPRMSPNTCRPANQVTPPGLSHHQYPSPSHPAQRFPTPSSPQIPVSAVKSPTQEPNFPGNQLYSGLDEGRLFASPGPPPNTSLAHPRKQHVMSQPQQAPQNVNPLNYNPSQQYPYGSPSNTSPSYPQTIQPQNTSLPPHHHHQHQQQPRQEQTENLKTLMNQYNTPSSSYTGTGQVNYAMKQHDSRPHAYSTERSPLHTPPHNMSPSTLQQNQQQQQLQQQCHLPQQHRPQAPPQQQQPQTQHQVSSQYQHQGLPQHYHQFHQASGGMQHHQTTQQPQQHPLTPQQSTPGQHMQQIQPHPPPQQPQQPPLLPPPYTSSQPKPPPPYPSSNPYNEFYHSPQHGDESQTPRMQQEDNTNFQSPNLQHAHPNFNSPYNTTNSTHFQTGSSPQPSAISVIRSNQPVQPVDNMTSAPPNANFNQPVRPPLGQMNPSVHPSSPSMNQPFRHQPSPSSSSTPSPGYFHQGPSPSSTG